MDAQSRAHALNVVIVNVPDLAVCLVAARLTESGSDSSSLTGGCDRSVRTRSNAQHTREAVLHGS